MVSPANRVKAAKIVFFGSVLGWPLTQFTVASGEPPFILGLSWGAIILTAADIWLTSDVRKEQDTDTSEIKQRCVTCGGTNGTYSK